MAERDATPQDFIGKMIITADTSCWNIWRFRFSDGTAIAIEAENNIHCGAGLQVCEECVEQSD